MTDAVAPLEDSFPSGTSDERDLYLRWLRYLRGAVMRKVAGLNEEQARWTPDGALLSLLGIVNHLTHVDVEWRWIEGGMHGQEVSRSEEEFRPGPELTVAAALAAYRERAAVTERAVRTLPLDAPCQWGEQTDLRWVLLHLINETARHAGHADATRELLDGTTGE
ncbi:MAG TPA: DinB family protein [Chloroflexota bacterium]|nr:DinB family protein [Chloroflexota bacterium]